jgi:alkaline phosphatase
LKFRIIKTLKAEFCAALFVFIALLIVSAVVFTRSPKLSDFLGFSSEGKFENVIIMISDGCGYEHITATDYYQYGASGQQVYENFPVRLGVSTYEYEGSDDAGYILFGYDPHLAWTNFDYTNNAWFATDSASAATAMSTGQKTYDGAIGVDILNSPLKHALEFAEEKGKATGVVTSVVFSHSTPAGFVAHNISRDNYADIANEMIYTSPVDVIMGCGAPDYDDDGSPADNDKQYVGGESTWNDLTDDNLVIGADANGDGSPDIWTVIRDRSTFQALANGSTPDRLIGIPRIYTTLQQARSGDNNAAPYVVPQIETVPTLAEMSKAALNILDNDKDGFFLMIEGGAIDWASHDNQSGRMIEEEIDFNHAVEAVVNWIEKNDNWNETLLIVTADHECGFLTGPGSNPLRTEIVNNGKGNVPGMEWHSDIHTNNIIPFFAKGPSAMQFTSVADVVDPVRGHYIDNTDIGRIIIGFFNQ